ncbi:unnamed protein product, partial [Wuchereria bancrofti]
YNGTTGCILKGPPGWNSKPIYVVLGWARIELEPVNIPLEQDDSILLSTVQSVIPGAHGLYYKDDNCKKALKYNGTTGCILKGPPGWNSKPIYVVLDR